jgi:5-methylcytosine-specific restriction endonuclease McrA
MTTEYNTLLKSPRWLEKRKIILARDNNKCRCCSATTGLQVHHRQYHVSKQTGQKKLPWEYQNKYLITLCEKCHTAGHEKFKIPSFTI